MKATKYSNIFLNCQNAVRLGEAKCRFIGRDVSLAWIMSDDVGDEIMQEFCVATSVSGWKLIPEEVAKENQLCGIPIYKAKESRALKLAIVIDDLCSILPESKSAEPKVSDCHVESCYPILGATSKIHPSNCSPALSLRHPTANSSK
jgi:hypothetical protein